MTNFLIQQINHYPPGHIFSAQDFVGMAPRNTIDQALLRLSKKGDIQKIAHGIFNKPKINTLIGNIPASIDDLVMAYAHKFGYQIQFHPAKAANLLGLSQYIVAQHVYLTDAPSKTVQLGTHTIQLKHVCPRKLKGIGTKAGLIVQSLYYFGKSHLDDDVLMKIKKLIDTDTLILLSDLYVDLPSWMRIALSRIGVNSNVC